VRAAYSLLSAHIVPPDFADTEFADMRAAYDALPESLKRTVEGLIVEHSVWHSRRLGGMDDVSEVEKATRPPSQHRLVHRHPGSGRKALYLASHISHVVGWPEDEGRALVAELTVLATRPQFVYRHRWRVGDLVVWDNLQTMHRGTPFDDTRYPRDMRRCTVSAIVDGPH
jgi:alpha-ketoglutarate-dependent 2,4-dichlorophenoxyacetate dioxygenase